MKTRTTTILLFLFLSVAYTCSSQIITTFAGTGTAGFSGDGGPATLAKLYGPGAPSVDAAGDVYFDDAGNFRIRRVSAAGIITTVAGNGSRSTGFDTTYGVPATSIPFYGDITVDDSGNMYGAQVAIIIKITSSGIFTHFAGNGSGTFSGDGGPATAAGIGSTNGSQVAADGMGNVYICDYSNSRIRKIDTAGIITTVAGNGTSGSTGDGGPATAAEIYQPQGLASDRMGNIYFCSVSGASIRKVSAAGIITTIGGTGSTGYGGDGGPATAATMTAYELAADNAGNVYFCEIYNRTVRKIDTAGIITRFAGDGTMAYCCDGGPATDAGLNAAGVTVDAHGNVYIGDETNNRLRVVYDTTATPTAVAPGLPHVAAGLHISPNPNYGSFSINLSSAVNEDAQIVVTDMLGAVAGRYSTVTNKETEIKLNVAASVYFVSAVTAKGSWVQKVMINK